MNTTNPAPPAQATAHSPLRILLIWASADWSTFDQSQGYYDSLRALGHTVHPFRLNRRLEFWSAALNHWHDLHGGEEPDLNSIFRETCNWVLIEAARFKPDLILVTSAMGFHPDALVMLRDHGFAGRVGLILSESPYDDEEHEALAPLVDFIWTNDRASVDRLSAANPQASVSYLPTAYHSAIHTLDPSPFPFDPPPISPDPLCDVLFVGTGFPERQEFLAEAIQLLKHDGQPMPNIQLHGFWNLTQTDDPGYDPAQPMHPILAPFCYGPISNPEAAARYHSAKIVLNFYRDGYGYSLNPRAYEIAACGAFQLAYDGPLEAHFVFGESIGYFHTPKTLASSIRHYLNSPRTRASMAFHSNRYAVRGHHSYLDRAKDLISSYLLHRPLLPLSGSPFLDSTLPPFAPVDPSDPSSSPLSMGQPLAYGSPSAV